jgi:hypothetical protein
MLDQLDAAYQTLLARAQPPEADRARLLGVLDDMRWYAERLGALRWETPPRPGRWSFAENLWHIVEQAIDEFDRLDELSRRLGPPNFAIAARADALHELIAWNRLVRR